MIHRLLERRAAKLQTSIERMNALNPLAVLERGYSAVKDEEGRIVSSVERLSVGQQIDVVLSDGSARARIESIRAGKQEKETEK